MNTVYRVISIGLIVLFLASTQLFAADTDGRTMTDEWSIDPNHSAIKFTVTHFFTPVDGQFEEYSGDIIFSPDDLENSRIDITIPVSGINTGNERRDNDLNSESFFNSSVWPNIHFVTNNIEQTGENAYVAHGELTMKDVTREFDLPFKLLGIMDHPMRQNMKVAGITANTTLNRLDYGVGVGNWAATAVVADEIEISVNLELHAPK